jgi:type IV pilus assembly protein PilO
MRFGIRELMLLAVLLALPLSSYWLVFRPVNREIGQAKAEIDHMRQRLTKVQESTARNQDLKRENEESRRQIDAIEARLPSSKEVDMVVRQVSDLAVESGLESPAIESDKPVTAAVYMEQPLKMKIAGDFSGYHEFLRKLEALPRITRILDMKLTRATEVNGNMKAEFTLSIYFQPEGKGQ